MGRSEASDTDGTAAERREEMAVPSEGCPVDPMAVGFDPEPDSRAHSRMGKEATLCRKPTVPPAGRPITLRDAMLQIPRRSATPPPVVVQLPTSSLLRRSLPTAPTAHGGKGVRVTIPRTGRRVRGLWSNERSSGHYNNPFAQLPNDTALAIFSHLTLLEVCVSSRVCKRWKYLLATHSPDRSDWLSHVDATDLVHRAFDRSGGSAAATGRVLDRRLSERTPQKLTLRNVHDRLSSTGFVPCLQHRLVELTITHYADLTDASLQAMLLSTLFATQPGRTAAMHPSDRRLVVKGAAANALRHLRLEHCHRLSNDAVRSIAATCPGLEALSLRGCARIDSVDALRDLWKLSIAEPAKPNGPRPATPSPLLGLEEDGSDAPASSRTANQAVASSALTASALASLFHAPPPSPTSVAAVAAVDAAPSSCAKSSPVPPSATLSSLFVPPPRKPDSANDLRPRPPGLGRRSGSGRTEGRLTDLDVSGTGVTAASLLRSISSERWGCRRPRPLPPATSRSPSGCSNTGAELALPKVCLERLIVTGSEHSSLALTVSAEWKDLPQWVDADRLREFRCADEPRR